MVVVVVAVVVVGVVVWCITGGGGGGGGVTADGLLALRRVGGVARVGRGGGSCGAATSA